LLLSQITMQLSHVQNFMCIFEYDLLNFFARANRAKIDCWLEKSIIFPTVYDTCIFTCKSWLNLVVATYYIVYMPLLYKI
jgi:hypothetical protein